MHIIKTKRSLADYFDLNRRYMKPTDAILFEDGKVTLDIIPRQYLAPICDKLLDVAFETSAQLQKNTSLEEVAEFLKPSEITILNGINQEFSLKFKN